MAARAPRTRPANNGRTTEPAGLSKETLELCDGLVNNISLMMDLPPDEFMVQARRLSKAKSEINAELVAKGGTPLDAQRLAAQG